MSLQNPLKPQEAMQDIETGEHFYPMTVPSQILMEDGSRLDTYLENMSSGGETAELLWENENTTVGFDAQTVKLDLSEYKSIQIVFKWSITSSYTKWTPNIKISNEKVYFEPTTLRSNKLIGRDINADYTGVEFSIGYIYESYGTDSLTEDSTIMIPYQIYGIKSGSSSSGDFATKAWVQDLIGGIENGSY